jgi:hypothetical protein
MAFFQGKLATVSGWLKSSDDDANGTGLKESPMVSKTRTRQRRDAAV